MSIGSLGESIHVMHKYDGLTVLKGLWPSWRSSVVNASSGLTSGMTRAAANAGRTSITSTIKAFGSVRRMCKELFNKLVLSSPTPIRDLVGVADGVSAVSCTTTTRTSLWLWLWEELVACCCC